MYLYIFTALVGLGTLIPISCQYLTGIQLYIGILSSTALALGNIVAAYQNDHGNKLKGVATSYLEDHLKRLGTDGVPLIIEIAKRPKMGKIIVEIISERLLVEPDPTVRGWMYVALGRIGGKKAGTVIQKGLSDDYEFVRQCAEDAWQLWQSNPLH